MEEKGIVFPELSCRTAAELPPPDFSAPGGGHPLEKPESFSVSSAPGVHRRSCLTTGGRTASTAAVRQLLRGELGGIPPAQLREYNPFRLHVTVHGLQSQGQSSFPPNSS
jgi:hypothetical protein